jgi:uncharacterized protein YqhQ
VILQIAVFNPLGDMFTYTPYFFLTGLLFFPPSTQRILFLFIAFVTGFLIDLSMGSGGVFASATLTFAFFRDPVLRLFQKDWHEKRTGFDEMNGFSLIRYIFLSSFLFTASVYFFDSLWATSFVSQWKSILIHFFINTIFYLFFFILFLWDNTPGKSKKL